MDGDPRSSSGSLQTDLRNKLSRKLSEDRSRSPHRGHSRTSPTRESKQRSSGRRRSSSYSSPTGRVSPRSPSKSRLKSPRRSSNKSPSRSNILGPKSPSRLGHKSPSRSGHKSPSRSGHKSPSRSGHKSPRRSGHKSPSRSEHKSPSRSSYKSPSHRTSPPSSHRGHSKTPNKTIKSSKKSRSRSPSNVNSNIPRDHKKILRQISPTDYTYHKISPGNESSRKCSQSKSRASPTDDYKRMKSPVQFRTPQIPSSSKSSVRVGDSPDRYMEASTSREKSSTKSKYNDFERPGKNKKKVSEDFESPSKLNRKKSNDFESPSKVKKKKCDDFDTPSKVKKNKLNKFESPSDVKKKKSKGVDEELKESRSKSKYSSSITVKTEPSDEMVPPPPPLAVKIEPGILRDPRLHTTPYFRPTVELEKQPLVGLTRCRVCKSYYQDDEEKARSHLCQHGDRVFLVSLPKDTYYYDVEEAILHLAGFGITKDDLRNKIDNCNLIKYPSNMKAFSCDICCHLDTNSEKDFSFHLKEDCGRGMTKEERVSHMISFCRGCHVRFSSKVDLELHIDRQAKRGKCFPSQMVINRLYDQSGAAVNTKQLNRQTNKEIMVQVKQEKLDKLVQVQVKMESQEHQMINVYNSPHNKQMKELSLPPRNMVQPIFSQMTVPPPQQTTNRQMSVPHSIIQPNFRQMSVPPSLPPTSALQQILMNAATTVPSQPLYNVYQTPGYPSPQLYPPFPTPPIPTLAPPFYSPAPVPAELHYQYPPPQAPPTPLPTPDFGQHITKTEQATFSPDDPSPAFSPLRPTRLSISPPNPRTHMSISPPPRYNISPPNPSTPLPTIDDLFTRTRPTSAVTGSGVVKVDIPVTPKMSNKDNCRRSACNWFDPHADTCNRLPILEKCSTGDCRPEDKHRYKPPCPKYQFYCNCKRDSDGRYRYFDNLTTKLTTRVPEGIKDDSGMEDKSICMRLLYRVSSRVLTDPRLTAIDYPVKEQCPVKSFSGRGRGWGSDIKLICTWSGVNMVRVTTSTNPHRIIESDDDDDITVCEQSETKRVFTLN